MVLGTLVLCIGSPLPTVVIGIIATACSVSLTSKVDAAILPSTLIVLGVCPSVIITTAWESALPLAVVCTVCFYVYPTILCAITSQSQEEKNVQNKENQIEHETQQERFEEFTTIQTKEVTEQEGVSLKQQISASISASKETKSAAVSKELSDTEKKVQFHDFIQTLVSLFEYQRMKNYQFAVLLLSAHLDINEENTKFETRCGEVCTSEEAANYTHPSFPPESMMSNYVVARPEGFHAEKFLLDNFPILLNQYYSLHKMPCQHILLYSWMLPCTRCAWEMIQVLSSHTKLCRSRVTLTLVYTIIQKNMDTSQVQEVLNCFKLYGINVQRHGYTKWLQPADR